MLYIVFPPCDFEATKMNMQRSIIWEFIFYAFELGYNAKKQPKIFVGPKVKVQLITVP